MPYVINAPPMFTFHHVNAYQVPAGGSSRTNGANGGSGKQLLVLDTVGWDEISFEDNQHNLTKDYYKGEAFIYCPLLGASHSGIRTGSVSRISSNELHVQ